MRTLILTLLLLLPVAVPVGSLVAQWGAAVEIGVARFGGTSRDSSGTTVGPYRPTTFGLRLDRDLGRTRLAVGVMYAKTGLAGMMGNVAVVDYDAASLLEIAPEVSIRVARLGAAAVARVEAGPAVDVWELDGDKRTRVGARGALAVECLLGGRFTASIRATGVVSGSMANADETPPGVERDGTRRGGVSVGLRVRL